jgi:uncharacterized sulfatase
VVSGDHGIPGFPRAKCNLYNIGCEVALAARLPGTVRPGRVVDDMVNIKDLAPTFIDIAGGEQPAFMPSKSLFPILQSDKQGQVDPERTWIITGRERHVAKARDKGLPYPQRSIRTHRYHYIYNFAAERWPMGDPQGLDNPDTPAPPYEELEHDTFVAYPDMDAGPTKAWMVHHRSEDPVKIPYALGVGKRDSEELYDLDSDPHYMHNLADDPSHQELKRKLHQQLFDELKRQQDPRLCEDVCRYEHSPYTDIDKDLNNPDRVERAGLIPQ